MLTIVFLIRIKPVKIIMTEIISEKIYSALPWPKSWSSSLGLLDILFPIKVIMDENISPVLLKVSASIDSLWNKILTINFITSKKRLPIIPRILAILILLNLFIY